MPSAISWTSDCVSVMPGGRSIGPDFVQSGLNDPANLASVSGLVGAVKAGTHALFQYLRSRQRVAQLGDRRAQRPGDVQPGTLGGGRSPSVAATQSEGAGQLGGYLLDFGLCGLGRLEASVRERIAGRRTQLLDAMAIRRSGLAIQLRSSIAQLPPVYPLGRVDAFDPVDEIQHVPFAAGVDDQLRQVFQP